ncbi:MAG TPA: PQQ-binding-like beta-propeller repeat protein, partial [Planctomycetaceae bacterium]|nr:PQQ-binding-like beta-propeller repeat protein [Planctomycetaceae bacterium]
MMPTYKLALLTAVLLGGNVSVLPADDWPMLGRDATRNPVSLEKNPPLSWQIEGAPTKSENGRPIGRTTESKNVKWSAPLGSNSYGDPVVADGLVWVGTNNDSLKPGEERIDAAVLMCFRETDGELLYRYVSPRLPQGRVHDWPYGSLACSPLIEGDRMWFTTNRAEVVCLDIGPLHRGEGEPKAVWKLDMMEQLGVFPRGSIMNIARFCSPAAYKDWIYVITGNGVDESGIEVPRPDAPSLVCLEKATGRVVWTDNSPGENILHGQWASPLAAEIDGRAQVVAPQGDGWLRSFDAATGKLIWKFDMNRKGAKRTISGDGTRNDILATPVLYENRIYIAGGQHPEHGEGPGRLVCIDPTKTGDLSAELAVDAAGEVIPHRRMQAIDPAKGERAVANPGSGLVWEFTERGDDFEDAMRRSVSSVAVHKGLVVAVDFDGLVHCLDARTGEKHWTHDVFARVLGAPLIVDDTIYVADDDGRLTMHKLGTEKQVLGEISHDSAAYCAPIFANGVLYVATLRRLYAIRDEQNAAGEGQTATERRPGHWPQWRGPNRDNVSTETGLLQEWPEEGPPLVWRVEGLEEGISPVSVAGGRLFTISRQDETEYVIALDEQTGRSLWSAYLGRTIQQSPLMQWLTQRIPTVDEDRLYAVSGLGDLACLRVS